MECAAVELVLLVLVALGLGGLAVARRTHGRIVIIWGERVPAGDENQTPTIRSGSYPAPLPTSPWEHEFRRRLRHRLAALPPASATGKAPPPLEAAPLAEGRYRVLPPPAARQE